MFSERNADADAIDTFQTLGVTAQSVMDNLAARMSGRSQSPAPPGSISLSGGPIPLRGSSDSFRGHARRFRRRANRVHRNEQHHGHNT